MAFKGLADRFEAKMEELYGHGSTTDGGPTGRNAEPYVEIKPNDNNREETNNDTRTIPIGSVKRDVKRVGKFLVSDRGLAFLLKQELLQTGNSIAETRIIDPLFVMENLTPYVHTDRPLSSPASNRFDMSDTLSPASTDTAVGHAGRMQSETKNSAISRVVGNTGISGLMGLIPDNAVTRLFRTVTGNGDGSTGEDDRPEIDIDGQLYSVLLWKGLQKKKNPQDYFSGALNSLKHGNLNGAVQQVTQGIGNVINIVNNPLDFALGRASLNGGPSDADRNQSWNTNLDGRRYFITSTTSADRYLKDSVLDDGSSFIKIGNNTPYSISGDVPALPTPAQLTNIQQNVEAALNNAVSTANDTIRKITTIIPAAPNLGIGTLPDDVVSQVVKNSVEGASNNPVADSMLTFDKLSMQARYADETHLTFVHQQLRAQQSASFAYWADRKVELDVNKPSIATEGLKPGVEIIIDPKVRNPKSGYNTNGGRYDLKNTDATVDAPTSAEAVQIGESQSDYVNVLFYDVVNKKAIPLRAFISGISQQTTVETADTTYIGRTDRNIVYIKGTRELSFQLRLQAFSPAELTVVWQKAEYLNSLCFPAMYSQGFMVPPFVKLTIGDMYREQPGYIRSITHTIEDGTSWDTVKGRQVPHGILLNVQYSIIENMQQSAKSHQLFGFGTPINQG